MCSRLNKHCCSRKHHPPILLREPICGTAFPFAIARTVIFTFIVKAQHRTLTQQVPHGVQLKPNRKNLTTHILCSIKQFLPILKQSFFFFCLLSFPCSRWNRFCYKQVYNMQNKHLGKKGDNSTKSNFWGCTVSKHFSSRGVRQLRNLAEGAQEALLPPLHPFPVHRPWCRSPQLWHMFANCDET